MIVIIDYGAGNAGSVLNMIQHCGYEATISSSAEDIFKASKLILPGVGSFDVGMNNLENLGLIKVLNKKVLEDKVPILGICLGMQLMTKNSEEGTRSGLGWIDAQTKKFSFDSSRNLKIPHMGWNTLEVSKEMDFLYNLSLDSRFYFVHSYFVECNVEQDIAAKTNHGNYFTSAFSHNNIYGAQFHPEKSHKFGKQIITNFLSIEQ